MTIVTLVYAQSRNGVIGRDGGLPWHLSSDLKRFKAVTMGKPVIMGRKTWDSLPKKPLPGRMNIVVTRHRKVSGEGAVVAPGVAEALAAAGPVPEVCVIGGGDLYRQFLPLAHRIHLTIVDVEVEGDTFAPVLDYGQWQVISREEFPATVADNVACSVLLLERRAGFT
jgi:dihydrofolate reductase